jgi:hypothetical protein
VTAATLGVMSQRIAGRDARTVSTSLREELSELQGQNRQLAESYTALARATLEFEEQGWKPISQLTEDGFGLQDVKRIAKTARLQMKSNPILKRGEKLQASYTFARGFVMTTGDRELPPRYQAIVDSQLNQEVLFGEQACKRNAKTVFSDGNLFAAYIRSAQRWTVVSIDQIVGVAVDSIDPSIVNYVRRNYTRVTGYENNGAAVTELVDEWIPMDHVNVPVRSLQGVAVNADMRLVDYRADRDNTSRWGVPGCLAALPWAWAYSEYLKDGSKLLKALSSIAWHVKSSQAAGAERAAQKMLSNRRTAATAATGSDVTLQAMPRSNAVDLETGRPLAAMAATAMEVSVEALLSDGGATGDKSAMFDQPTLNAAYERQGNWERFFERCLAVMGVRNPKVKFNPIVVDPAYREVQSISQAWMTGLFSPEVVQSAYARTLGIEAPGEVPSGVMVPNNVNSLSNSGATLGSGRAPGQTNVATAQGNSGAGVDDLSNSDNSNRDTADNAR